MNVGILGIGTYLPPEIRKNDWWPQAMVDKWRERAARRLARIQEQYATPPSEGGRLALEALTKLGVDPFQGGIERRVMSPDMKATDMETAAAREAIARSGINASEIDLCLSFTLCPDYINVPGACVVHSNLGLSEKCTTMAVDAVCNSFMMQLTLAQAMIASGRARYALLTQSSAITRLTLSGENYDTWFGDAATAVIVGPVSEGFGIIGSANRTDGKLHDALVCGVPGKHWFDDGAAITYSLNHQSNFDMVVKIVDRAKQVVDEALAEAKVSVGEVDFYACHQAFLWLRDVSQRHIGMDKARSVDTFKWAGTVSGANLPLVMAMGEREGLLRAGDRVAMFQGGTGMTWSGMVLRWGK